MTEYRIQPVGRTHAKSLADLHAACFAKGWSHLEFESFFERAGVFAAMIYDANEPVGFIICWMIEDQCDLLAMGVEPNHRRDGAGHQLLDYAMATAKDMGAEAMVLEVNINNEAAQKLYGDEGFEQFSIRKNYYSHPDGTTSDAVCMRKLLR